jgi:hypothetical protein
MFCFECGLVGHNEDNCDQQAQVKPLPEGSVNPSWSSLCPPS